MVEKLLVTVRLRLYPLIHGLGCPGSLDVLVPREDYIAETGDREAYMLCRECGKRYHLVNIEY
jgi:hypothetical protein